MSELRRWRIKRLHLALRLLRPVWRPPRLRLRPLFASKKLAEAYWS
jgi:hypothetical protein